MNNLHGINIPVPQSPFDNLEQKISWLRGYEHGMKGGLFHAQNSDEWAIGYRAAIRYKETLGYFARQGNHDAA